MRLSKPQSEAWTIVRRLAPCQAQNGRPTRAKTARCGTFLALAATLSWAILFPASTRASENELQVTAGAGYSALPPVGEGLDGVGGGAEATYHITPLWGLSLGGFFGHHFGDTIPATGDDEEPTVYEATNVTSLWLGPRLSLDYFVVIPYISLAPELLLTNGELQDEQSELEFALRWTLGFDYRPQREWSVGIEASYHSFITDPIAFPVYISTLFRVSWHYGFDVL